MQMCPNPRCGRENPDHIQFCPACQEQQLGLLGQNTLLEGRYQIIRVLGCGGMGAVYLANDLRIAGRLVAVKENLNTMPQAQAQFQSEVRLMVGIRHSGLPTVSDQFLGPRSRQYLVMDYIEGETLDDIVSRRGPLPEGEVISLAIQLVESLDYLHCRAIIHRDVKPANIKLTPEGRSVLVDFGIAKTHVPGHRTHTAARGVGSPGFASLEQYGTGTDTRSDLYSLGAVLYFLVTGQVPPEAPDLAAGRPLAPPRNLRPTTSLQLQQVIFKAMAPSPAQRYQSAAELRHALLTLHSAQTTRVAPTALVPSASPAWPTWIIFAGVVSLVLMLGSGVVLGRMLTSTPTLTPLPQANDDSTRDGSSPSISPTPPALAFVTATSLPVSDILYPTATPALATTVSQDSVPPSPTLFPTASPVPTHDSQPRRVVIGRSVRGAALEVAELGAGERHVVLIGGLHSGFAPSTVEIAERFVEHFTNNVDEIPSTITLHIMPNANPDSPLAPGKKSGRLNANHVDLNRNWGCGWQPTSTWRDEPVSGGGEAFSEPESWALRDYLVELSPIAVVFWEARVENGQVSAGGCNDGSRVSGPLAELYSQQAGYIGAQFQAYSVSGATTDWLDSQGIPAIAVLLPEYESVDWANHLRAVRSMLERYGD